MRFLDRESLRVVLLNAKQHPINVATVSQGTLNEAPAHPAVYPKIRSAPKFQLTLCQVLRNG